MDEQWKKARQRYEEVEIPQELEFAVASAIRAGNRRSQGRRRLRRGLATSLAACACFALLVNANPGFASAVEQVPLLGSLARIITVDQYTQEDEEHLIDVRLPALENTGNTDLEQRINTEIRTRINEVIQQAEERAREARQAYVETGGKAEDFIPIIIDVDYEVKCQNSQYLSFIVEKTETLASAYTEFYTYNIDLSTGKELTLRDVLGDNYMELANQAVREGIAQRSQDPDNQYFSMEEDGSGFQSIAPDQRFYLNERGNPVILFEKYEIAPGYMGAQEFEVERP